LEAASSHWFCRWLRPKLRQVLFGEFRRHEHDWDWGKKQAVLICEGLMVFDPRKLFGVGSRAVLVEFQSPLCQRDYYFFSGNKTSAVTQNRPMMVT
jgi:hypothetical protein